MTDSKDAVILDLQQRLEDMVAQRDDALARVDELEREVLVERGAL